MLNRSRILACLALAAVASAAPEDVSSPSASVTLGQGGKLVPGWQPAVFSLENPTASPLRVRLVVEPLDSDRPWQRVEREIDLPPSGRQRQTLLFRTETWTDAVRLSAEAGGKELLDKSQRRVDASLRNAWQDTPTVLALTAGGASWVQEIRSVPARNNQGNQDRFDLVEGEAGTLPSRPEGFGKVAAILCSGFPFENAPDGALDALAAWTASGGHLILTASPQGLAQGLVSRIAPLKGYRTSACRDFSSLEKTCGTELPARGEAPCLEGAPAGLPPPPGNWVQRFPWGRGWVSVMRMDPGLQPFRGWSGMQKVWAVALQPAAPSLPEPWAARDDRFGYDPRSNEDAIRPELCRVLRTGLARALPAGVISLVVAIYLVVMGPLQFLLLKRFWSPTRAVLTIPALAAAFTIGVMVLGYATRGVGTRVNQTTLHLALPGGGELVRTYAAVFSSFPGSLEAGLAPGAAGEVLLPGTEAADEGFHVLKDASIEEVSVRMWSTRFLGASRHFAKPAPLSHSNGEILNAGPVRFERVLVVNMDDKERTCGDLGPLEPGKSRPVEPPSWKKVPDVLPDAASFEAAFLRGLADQCAPGRWILGVSRRTDDALLTLHANPERPLSVTLMRLP